MTDAYSTPERLRTRLDRDGFAMVYRRGEGDVEVGAIRDTGRGFSFVPNGPFNSSAKPTHTYATLDDVIEDGWKIP